MTTERKNFVISDRAKKTPASPIRRLSGLATEARSRGIEIVQLNIGQPDLAAPEAYLSSCSQFKNRVIAYEDSCGSLELRIAWSSFLERTRNLTVPVSNIVITSGASEALMMLFSVCCDPDDEVVVLDPTYANYIGFAAISGVHLKPVATDPLNCFAVPSIADLDAAITIRTKAVLLCNPNNPTGTWYPPDVMRGVFDLCKKRGVLLIVDETYREIIYDGRAPYSVMELVPQDPLVVVVDSMSKRFSLCGARIGTIVSFNPEILGGLLRLMSARLSVSTLEQYLAVRVLKEVKCEDILRVRDEYERRRDTVLDSVSSGDPFTLIRPEGAFYCLATLPVSDAEDFASFLLKEFNYNGSTVFLAPAQGFYIETSGGKNKVRLAFVLNPDQLRKGVDLLKRGLDAYIKRT